MPYYGTKIMIYDGECHLTSNTDILGIEIDFIGNAEITPTLPDGWIMQGNNNKILMIGLQGLPIQNTKLFEYVGEIKLRKILLSDVNSQRVFCDIENVKANWLNQNWSFSAEADKWENFKNKAKKGSAKKIKYNLPDYNLPKAEKPKIKTRRTTTTAAPTYTTGGGSSGGSGGY